MGDLIDDIKMAKYLHNTDEDLLTVGFFNNPGKDGHEMLMEYQKNFDIVVLNDGNLHFLHYFLTRIASQQAPEDKNVHENLTYYEMQENEEIGKHYKTKQHKINELFDLI